MNVSQAEQYPHGLNQAIHALAIDAWSRGFEYPVYLHFVKTANRVSGNVLAPMTKDAYLAVCDEWEAKMEKDMAKVFSDAVITGTGAMSIHIDEHDQMLVKHWDESILFTRRNHTE